MSDYPALHLLIAGDQLTGGGRNSESVINPATEVVLGELPHASTDDLDRALNAAAEGFQAWRKTPAEKREKVLTKAASLLRERSDMIGAWLTQEQGKPLAEGRGEVKYAANLLEFYAQEARRTYGRTMVRGEDSRVEVQYHPVGPVAGFAPWNFPAINVMRKIGGALAAGCSVIVKPSEETPATGIAMVQALLDAGVPGNVVQCVFGVPSDVSEHLLKSPIIRKLTFTGSTPVGKQLAKLAAEDLKITTMELGGHAPVLIFDDCDVDRAAKVMAGNKFRNAGQVCVSPTRFLVAESAFESFRDTMVRHAEALTIGNGMDSDTKMGPMANARGRENVQKLIADAKEKGADLLTGGDLIGNQGFFHQPTVLTGVSTDAEIMNTEPFGPVAIINPVADEAAMIEEANRLPYGLAAYAWTDDAARRRRLAADIEAGMLGINGAGVSTADAPFGGWKWSGYGSEDGKEGVMACMVPKTVHEA